MGSQSSHRVLATVKANHLKVSFGATLTIRYTMTHMQMAAYALDSQLVSI